MSSTTRNNKSPMRRPVRGQAMVEFTIIAGVLLLLILGTLQFALIYHAKITLNYAAFETARAGTLNHARMWAMELAFARGMAPLYTTPYVEMGATGCTSNFALSGNEPDNRTFTLSNAQCARQRVRDMITNNLVRIVLVNPSQESFAAHEVRGEDRIPNDSLMYRSARVRGVADQSIQDANLIKINTGFCYELIVPLVDRVIWRMIATAPTALEPENFGPPQADSFASTCVAAVEADGSQRYGIPLYSDAIMRMQSDPVFDTFCGGDCP